MAKENEKININNIVLIIVLSIFFPYLIPLFVFSWYRKLKNNPITKADIDMLEEKLRKFGVEIEKDTIKKDVASSKFEEGEESEENEVVDIVYPQIEISNKRSSDQKLNRRKKYLQIALNSDLSEARRIIGSLPSSERIIIEAGTPLIKRFGIECIEEIRSLSQEGTYIVADSKTTDLAEREVEMMADAGASAITCLGVAPIETINKFIEKCFERGIDPIIDMMNVEEPLLVLKKLKKQPTVVILHRGVDEEKTKEKIIPYYQIKQIKGNYNTMIAIAGGDSQKEIETAIFNDADIVVLWKKFYNSSGDVGNIARGFLSFIK